MAKPKILCIERYPILEPLKRAFGYHKMPIEIDFTATDFSPNFYEEEIKVKRYDFILIHLGEVGKDTIHKIRAENPKTTIIGVSNFPSDYSEDIKQEFDRIEIISGPDEKIFIEDLLREYGLLK